jgi:hypothetical protein
VAATIGDFFESGYYYIWMGISDDNKTTEDLNLITENKTSFYIKYLMKEKALSN